MKGIILSLIFLTVSLQAKVVIGKNSEIIFGSREIQIYGGISSERTENSLSGAVIFSTGSTIESIGSALDTISNINSMENIAVIKNSGMVTLGQNLNINGNVNIVKGLIDSDGHTLILSNGSRISGMIDRETIMNLNSMNSVSPEDMKISSEDNRIKLSWSEVKGSTGYKVYSSDNPVNGFQLDTSGVCSGNEWTTEIDSDRRFFYVIATDKLEEENKIQINNSVGIK